MRESDIERYLVDRVHAAGGEVRKMHFVNRRGAPDRLVLLPWRTPFVELKASGKRSDAHQIREHRILRKFGFEVLVIDSFEEVDALVRRD